MFPICIQVNALARGCFEQRSALGILPIPLIVVGSIYAVSRPHYEISREREINHTVP
jgi:hypothetical protein